MKIRAWQIIVFVHVLLGVGLLCIRSSSERTSSVSTTAPISTQQSEPTPAPYTKTQIVEPEKAAYDMLLKPQVWANYSYSELLEMHAAYENYLHRYPTSPLIPEVEISKKEVDRLINKFLANQKARTDFEKIEIRNLSEIVAYPQKHIGLRFRFEGQIRSSGSGFDQFHISASGTDIMVSAASLQASLHSSLQGKPRGTPGDFAVRVGRNQKTGGIEYFLEESWTSH